MLYFITGNQKKFEEVQAILGGDLEMLNIDLDEIQELDAKKIIEHKLQQAFLHHDGPFIVEDTSLYLDGLQGLPGPFIKWFLKTVGNEGVYKFAEASGNNKATAKTFLGYAKDKNTVQYFEGIIAGTIVPPRGPDNFGWDVVFQPDGYEQTFAEMSSDQKNQISMRKLAAEQLKVNL